MRLKAAKPSKPQKQQHKPQNIEAATQQVASVREPDCHVSSADLKKQESTHAAHMQRKMLGSRPRIPKCQGPKSPPERV